MERIDVKTVKERTVMLHKFANAISYRRNRMWIDWHGEIVVDEIKRDGVQGRNFAYKPVFVKENIPLGSRVNVKIRSVFNHSLVAA
jgi:tRNA A37 methylthiotransferase MiaB